MDHAHKARLSLKELVAQDELAAAEGTESPLQTLISSIIDKSPAASSIKLAGLERGVATIPLPGIDVPFHSSYLKAGVSSFRRHLYDAIPQTAVDLDRLVGKYVPNLTATPFEISRPYFESVLELTGSKIVGDVIQRVSPLLLRRSIRSSIRFNCLTLFTCSHWLTLRS